MATSKPSRIVAALSAAWNWISAALGPAPALR
jgi:hypothetical protein